MYERIREIKAQFESLFATGEDGNSESFESSISNFGSFRKDYGWYYVIDQLVRDTPNMTEDQLLEWDAERFLFRLQYLKHKGEIELFNLKQQK